MIGSKLPRRIIKRMGVLLNMRDISNWLDVTYNSGTTMVLSAFHESFADMKKRKGKNIEVSDAELLCEKAENLGYIKRKKVNNTYNYILDEKGILIVRKKFKIPSGLINAYIGHNPWVALAVGFGGGALAVFIIQRIMAS